MNIGKINPAILINRSIEKHEISEHDLAVWVEHYWNTKIPMVDFYKYNCKNQEELIKKALPYELLYCIESRKFNAKQKKSFEKLKKYAIKQEKWYKKHKAKLHVDYLVKWISEVKKFKQDAMDKGWTKYHANQRVKQHFGFDKIPK